MKQVAFLILFLSTWTTTTAQTLVSMSGKIGKHPIEMELDAETDEDSEFSIKGKYRYQGKTAYLDLEGHLLDGDLLWMEESWNGETSGEFYLENEVGGGWKGRWLGNGKFYDVLLTVTKGEMVDLRPYDLATLKEKASNTIEGTYGYEEHFINDMWFTEDNPTLELGYNGGMISVRELPGNRIQVEFDLVCSPTYHLASFYGEASQIGESAYAFNAPLDEGDEESCHLEFRFVNKSLEITQHSAGHVCGFGARAYAGGTYDKVSDKARDLDAEEGETLESLFED